ncbi:MAG TPA: MoxR family ATPase [Planctomycetota bacterium]|nr:MoxR family ATPase [Planctomycetota bacterium]
MSELRGEVSKALIGQHDVLDQALVALLAAGHVLLEGVPGLGKTLLVTALARAMHGRFARVQFTPDLMPSDVVGHTVYEAATGSFRLKRGPAFTNLLLADEINRAPARTQAALLEVMQERQITIDGHTSVLDEPFMVFATQNPIEQEGTYPLPEAQLDRFLLKVVLTYPSAEEELTVVQSVTTGRTGSQFQLQDVMAVAGPEDIVEAQNQVAQLHVEESVARYAVDICRATRNSPGLSIGAGPRGAIALVRTARAKAFLAGRDFVLPDDLREIALPALRHRVVPAPELALEGRGADSILLEVLDQVAAPRS